MEECIGKLNENNNIMDKSKTFLLFVFGMFEDHEDIEYFCTDVLGDLPFITAVRYVIENSQNIIVIFESELDYPTLSKEMFTVLVDDNIKFYFMFDRHSLVTAHLPLEVKNFIFKPSSENTIVRIEYDKPEKYQPILDLDHLLEKIEQMGIDSLTPEEKNFLDNFEN
jgi:hypothetical protein